MRFRPLSLGLTLIVAAALTIGYWLVHALWREREITEGQFKALVIGDSVAISVGKLRQMNVEIVYLDSTSFLSVKHPKELHRLSVATKLIIEGGGSVLFSGDTVADLHIPPARQFSRWRDLLGTARTRREAFDAIRTILSENPGTEVREVTPGIDRIRLAAVESHELALLMKHDMWRITFSDRLGFWSARLLFEDGILRKIVCSYSPIEI